MAKTLKRFDVDAGKDTLLLFQEDSNKPVASISMTDLPTNTILEVRIYKPQDRIQMFQLKF